MEKCEAPNSKKASPAPAKFLNSPKTLKLKGDGKKATGRK